MSQNSKQDQARPRYNTKSNLVVNLYSGVAEKTVARSSQYAPSQVLPWNPDDLYQKTGDYSIYEAMINDDQVNVSMQLKKDLILGSGFDVMSEEDDQTDMAKEIEAALKENTETPFEDQLEQMISAYDYGFSASEKVWKKTEDGKLTLKYLRTRNPATWMIFTDEHGRVTRYEQWGQTNLIKLDTNSILHYVNKPAWQNPYGTSDLRACHDAWFVKRQLIRFYAIFLEKAASPTPIGRYPKGTTQIDIDTVFNTIKRLQTKTALLIPKDFEMEFLESKSKGEAYEKGINLFNMFIGRAILIPDLLGFQGSETSGGSFSLGKSQMEVFYKHIGRRRRTLEGIVNNEIIRPMVLFNHGRLDNYPKFKLRPISQEEALNASKIWVEATKARIYKPTIEEINHFRSIVNYPESEEGLHEEPEPTDEPLNQFPSINPSEEPEGEIEQEQEEEVEVIDNGCGGKKKFKKPYKQPNGDFHKKTNFKALQTQLDGAENVLVDAMAPIIDATYQDLFDQLAKKKILETQDITKMDSVKLKNGPKMTRILNKDMASNYKNSAIIAQNELKKSNFQLPLTDEKFVQTIAAENFDYIGDWQYSVEKQARVEMVSAMKDGRPLSSVIEVLSDEGKKSSNVSMQRYARTKFTETMNRARVDTFTRSGVVDGYQYSAIMDGRTTTICAGLHGKKFRAGTEPIPPLHFNCRSTLIPITIFEEFKPDTKVGKQNINTFIEKEKGKGFATK